MLNIALRPTIKLLFRNLHPIINVIHSLVSKVHNQHINTHIFQNPKEKKTKRNARFPGQRHNSLVRGDQQGQLEPPIREHGAHLQLPCIAVEDGRGGLEGEQVREGGFAACGGLVFGVHGNLVCLGRESGCEEGEEEEEEGGYGREMHSGVAVEWV